MSMGAPKRARLAAQTVAHLACPHRLVVAATSAHCSVRASEPPHRATLHLTAGAVAAAAAVPATMCATTSARRSPGPASSSCPGALLGGHAKCRHVYSVSSSLVQRLEFTSTASRVHFYSVSSSLLQRLEFTSTAARVHFYSVASSRLQRRECRMSNTLRWSRRLPARAHATRLDRWRRSLRHPRTAP